MTYGHNGTATDLAMNYFYGIVLSISIPISLLLNPLVFYYNCQQKLTIASGLFLVLSALDFLFSFRSFMTVYNLLKSELDPLYDPHPTMYQRFQGLMGYTIGYTSMFVTMVMCVVRYTQIIAPFWSLSNLRLIVSVAITAICIDMTYSITVGLVGSFVTGDTYFSIIQGMITTETRSASSTVVTTYFTIMIPFFIKVGCSVVFSLLTIMHLRTVQGQLLSDMKRRSIVTILLLNAGNAVWLSTSLLGNILTNSSGWGWGFVDDDDDAWNYHMFYLWFFDFVMAQCVLAAYNPLIICLRNSNIRSLIRGFFLTGKMGVDTSYNLTPQ